MKQTACVLGVVIVCSSACEMQADETVVGELSAAVVVDTSSHSNGVIGTVLLSDNCISPSTTITSPHPACAR